MTFIHSYFFNALQIGEPSFYRNGFNVLRFSIVNYTQSPIASARVVIETIRNLVTKWFHINVISGTPNGYFFNPLETVPCPHCTTVFAPRYIPDTPPSPRKKSPMLSRASSFFKKEEEDDVQIKSYFATEPHIFSIREATSAVAEGKSHIDCPNHVEYPVTLDEIIPGYNG